VNETRKIETGWICSTVNDVNEEFCFHFGRKTWTGSGKELGVNCRIILKLILENTARRSGQD
jgi:hypothetical protein